MKFINYQMLFIDKMNFENGFSFGIHIDYKRFRIDFHILNRTISIGKVPVWNHEEWGDLAASGSWHERNYPVLKEEYLGPRLHIKEGEDNE